MKLCCTFTIHVSGFYFKTQHCRLGFFFALPIIQSFNTRYMTNSTLVSLVKMEYGWNFSISGLKMMMKSGLGKIFLRFLHALTMVFLLLNLYFWSKFSNKNDMVRAWRNFKNIFPRPLFIIIFRPEMLKFHPYSILTGDTMIGFVISCMLRWIWGSKGLYLYSLKLCCLQVFFEGWVLLKKDFNPFCTSRFSKYIHTALLRQLLHQST